MKIWPQMTRIQEDKSIVGNATDRKMPEMPRIQRTQKNSVIMFGAFQGIRLTGHNLPQRNCFVTGDSQDMFNETMH